MRQETRLLNCYLRMTALPTKQGYNLQYQRIQILSFSHSPNLIVDYSKQIIVTCSLRTTRAWSKD